MFPMCFAKLGFEHFGSIESDIRVDSGEENCQKRVAPDPPAPLEPVVVIDDDDVDRMDVDVEIEKPNSVDSVIQVVDVEDGPPQALSQPFSMNFPVQDGGGSTQKSRADSIDSAIVVDLSENESDEHVSRSTTENEFPNVQFNNSTTGNQPQFQPSPSPPEVNEYELHYELFKPEDFFMTTDNLAFPPIASDKQLAIWAVLRRPTLRLIENSLFETGFYLISFILTDLKTCLNAMRMRLCLNTFLIINYKYLGTVDGIDYSKMELHDLSSLINGVEMIPVHFACMSQLFKCSIILNNGIKNERLTFNVRNINAPTLVFGLGLSGYYLERIF